MKKSNFRILFLILFVTFSSYGLLSQSDLESNSNWTEPDIDENFELPSSSDVLL